ISISHRALLLGALAEGRSTVSGCSGGQDVAWTASAIRAMGADVRLQRGEHGLDGEVRGGRSRLSEPVSAIECGNSGTTMRLLAGLVSSLDGLFLLQGDQSLSSRPMARVLAPLAAMGAKVDGRRDGTRAPLSIRGGHLRGRDIELEVASAQVKSAVLLAGLAAEGATAVHEPFPTRAHTEEMLTMAGVGVDVRPRGAGRAITVRSSPVQPLSIAIPGDPSQAAFWVVAACCTPGSEVTVEDVYLGPERAAFVEVLRRMGADVQVVVRRELAGVPVGDVTARHRPLTPTEVAGAEVPALVDEIPVLAVAAAFGSGTTTFSGAAEMRVKESDRIATTVALLHAFGVAAEPMADGLVVHGRGQVGGDGRTAVVESRGDHRIAMAGAVMAVASGSELTTICDWSSVATSYPDFASHLSLLGGTGEESATGG
ncbi:MAG: 3-phosphoshikimate 1-carboxyvinyltransferase, partial [Actinomycetota bacterium]|nr:3-phosphoshikimate 1-carboxyvinyltransferase [Actinomycetota bacterium]